MNLEQFQLLIKDLPCGKLTPQAVYIHKSALQNEQLTSFLNRIQSALKLEDYDWNIAKFWKNDFKFSLLIYPNFSEESYPALAKSLFIDLDRKYHRLNDYLNTDNPPVLHRKELMVTKEHPFYEEFLIITQEGEQAGLYENSRAIGFKLGWESTITSAGYELVDGRLFRTSALTNDDKKIDRHKTAIVRHGLSSPLKILFNKGYLNGDYSVFDYGCGLGDDISELQANGIDASGWDPNFKPDAELYNADVVNLGFVLNVIEDVAERIEALHNAFALSDKFLIVSCMLTSESKLSQMTPYKDGVITSRNTFQKYYFQSELQLFIEDSLEKPAISAGPGIFIIFKDELEEQKYLSSKLRRHRQWTTLNKAPLKSERNTLLLEKHHQLVEDYWNTVLTFGRLPASDEFNESKEVINTFGSAKKLFNLLINGERKKQFEQAKALRQEDYLVYFALELFSKRLPYKNMSEEKRRDIKALFLSINSGREEAKELLFQIANNELLQDSALKASKYIPSIYNAEHSLLLHAKYINELPVILRIYAGAAAVMYGDWNESDVIKVHLTSGKVTFMVYDDFLNKPIPRIVERVKVKLAQQDIDYFDYVNEVKRPPLLNKHEFMTPKDERYKDQQRLDKKLIKLGVVDASGEQHMSMAEFNGKLASLNKQIKGYRIYTI
ncbi:MAG: DNA phosphorothioation-associated putative methyltransferase [Thalassotalea sp.]|nr:DNA phosphorothioation-associated putative methyltransferase [Thalassotalea sp.]